LKPINESSLQNSLDSGSTKRLKELRADLKRDSDTKPLYDDRAIDVLLQYAYDKREIISVLNYLASLKDDNGIPFSRSYYSYELFKDSWVGFEQPECASFRWNVHYQNAAERVKHRYADAHLVPLEYSSDMDIVEAVTDWDTSAGWSKVLTGLTKKSAYVDDIFANWSQIRKTAIEDGSFNCPIIPGRRTQVSGAFDEDGNESNTCKHKSRAINMIDLNVIIAERKWAKPLTAWLAQYPYSAIGKPDQWIAHWTFGQRTKMRSYISLDYSKYDSTIPSWLIKTAFEVIRAAFDDICDPQLLEVVEEDFLNKNIITGDDVFFTNHGNPSGSGFTAIINGICNEIITETWLDWKGLEAEYNIMGDDNLIYLCGSTVSQEMIDSVSSYIYHNFGVRVNASKSSFGTPYHDPEYLSRFWTVEGGQRDKGEVIGLLGYPETYRAYDKYEELTPELVVFSYILAYPATMRKLMNVWTFLRNTGLCEDSISWTKEARLQIPYNIRTYVEEKHYGEIIARHRALVKPPGATCVA
jgi:hypothetical protein